MVRPTDPAMLGEPQYERVEGDFYPTPVEFTDCLASVVDLTEMSVWEPACGEGHMSKRLQRFTRGVVSTDLFDRGYGTPGIDFFKATRIPPVLRGAYGGDQPAIITNPPYGALAERFIRHALQLLAPVDGFCAMFLRTEYDTAKDRMDLFRTHPYLGKIICTKRPRWIEGSKGSPRHNYSWYLWDYRRPANADPFIKLIHPNEALPTLVPQVPVVEMAA
jgi:hypothetical protein